MGCGALSSSLGQLSACRLRSRSTVGIIPLWDPQGRFEAFLREPFALFTIITSRGEGTVDTVDRIRHKAPTPAHATAPADVDPPRVNRHHWSRRDGGARSPIYR